MGEGARLDGEGVSIPAFNLEEYRVERTRRLERDNEFLDTERSRLEALLADALRVAVAGTGVSPLALLEQLAILQGTNLSRGAFLEHRERMHAEALVERTIRVLRETS